MMKITIVPLFKQDPSLAVCTNCQHAYLALSSTGCVQGRFIACIKLPSQFMCHLYQLLHLYHVSCVSSLISVHAFALSSAHINFTAPSVASCTQCGLQVTGP